MFELSTLLLVASVSLVAAISPGPDFFIVVRNCLVYSRRAGIWTSFGVAVGLLFHLAYTLVGIALLIAESPFCYNLLKFGGVAYLFYLGANGVYAFFKNRGTLQLNYTRQCDDLSAFTAFKQGFLTNLLNPKCALFFMSLFSQFITPATPMWARFEYVSVNWLVSFGWFIFLSYLITGRLFASRIERFHRYIDGVMGALLMLVGLKILFV